MKRKLLVNDRDEERFDDFEEYLSKCGITLGSERHLVETQIEPLVKKLTVSMLDADNCDLFLKQFEEHVGVARQRFKVAMLPLKREDSASTQFNSESLVRVLLRVPPLAEGIADLLLRQLPDTETGASGSNVAALIVSQFRWMTSQCDDVITAKLPQILPSCPLPVQRDVIAGLPEMTSDASHPRICDLLLELLEKDELVPCILEAISELTLTPEYLEKAHGSVQDILGRGSLPRASLPAAIRFLLHTSSPATVIPILREKVRIESSGDEDTATAAGSTVLCLECLEQVLRFQGAVKVAWLGELHRSEKLSTLDLFTLLILYRLHARPRTVLTTIKLHLARGNLSKTLLKSVFSVHRTTSYLYAVELLKVAQGLLTAFPTHPLPRSLYTGLFHCSHLHGRQEVVGSLLTLTGATRTRDSAIDTLLQIKEQSGDDLDRFASLLGGLLDYLNTLTVPQARKVLFLLVSLNAASSTVTDDIHILTRKYLSHPDAKLNRLGVIGSCALLQALSHEEPLSKAKSLLQRLRGTLKDKVELRSLFLEELSACILRTSCPFAGHVFEIYADLFYDIFVADQPAENSTRAVDILCLEGEDTLDNNPYVSINLWKVVEERRTLPLLFPFLRLLGFSSQQRADQPDLADIDVIIGCYIRMAPLDTLCASDGLALVSLFNLIVEMINVFHVEIRPLIRSKVVRRLELLLELLGKVATLSPAPSSLLPVVFDTEPRKGTARSQQVSGGGEGSSRKAAADESSCNVLNASDPGKEPTSQLQPSSKPGPEKAVPGFVSLSALDKLVGFTRELDVEVVQVLNYANTKEEKDDEEVGESESSGSDSEVKIPLPVVCLLLEDVQRKCKLKLRPGPFLKAAGHRMSGVSEERLVGQILGVLPAICKLMEDHRPASSPESEDSGPSMATQEELDSMDPAKTRLFELVFGILELVFSWPGFSPEAQEGWLEVLGGRTVGTQGPLSARRRRSLQFLLGFSEACSSFASQVSLVRCCSVMARGACREPRIADISKRCLSGSWEGGTKHAEGVGFLVGCLLEHGGEMADVVGELQAVVDKTGSSLPSLSRATLPVVYKVVSERLVAAVRENGEDAAVLADYVVHFATLISFLKLINSRPMLRTALSLGQRFLDAFLSKSLPTLSGMMKEQWMDVQMILKKLQTPTRYLHHVTGYSKSVRDIALTAKVPQLKKTLEHFVLKVKAMLAAHGCTAAFWVGNLKQRNLKGEEIFSQQPQEEEEEGEEVGASDISELSIDTDEDEDGDQREEEAEEENPDAESYSDSMSIGY